MALQMLMGNQAIALGAMQAGVNVVAGYPGTPSSEIIETIAKHREKTGVYVEWSVNEKAAAELAGAASMAGSRTLITMKQVGLNVASDPVMCLSYVGVKGGMVIVSADDPGPISSQTEQDTRAFGSYSKLPVLDPSSPSEAYSMVQKAFELSEKYGTPVILRPTTRVCHAYESMEIPELPLQRERGLFEKDSKRWVIFPRLSFENHKKIFERNESLLPAEFSSSPLNRLETSDDKTGDYFGIATGGISYSYVKDALSILRKKFPDNAALKSVSIFKVGTPYPFPSQLAESFLKTCAKILVVEELDPVIEKELTFLTGKTGGKVKIFGKLTRDVSCAGENSVEKVMHSIAAFIGINLEEEKKDEAPKDQSAFTDLPVRPPVLCAGCPHRGSFYAVKKAMKGKKTIYCGDIGCYTLGNAKPLDMCDSCLCMGADVTMAQGFYHNDPEAYCFSFIGDSTFFASGITGVVNAVYNKAKITLCVLDNSTTAMTGHQPHPGTGRTMMGDITEKISIPKILSAIGVNPVLEVDPFNLYESVEAVKKASETEGVSAIIFKSPCISIAKQVGYTFPAPKQVDTIKCIGCRKCINELGCPAMSLLEKDKKPVIDTSLCTGCGLCASVCPVDAIS